jgi:putative tricarboxylic transport membrane protein
MTVGTVVLLCLGVACLAEGSRMGLWQGTTPRPGLFPASVSVALIALCVAELAIDLRTASAASAADGGGALDGRRLRAYIIALAFYAVSLEPLGYLLSTAVVFLFLLRFAEHMTWKVTLTITAAVLIICNVLFVRLLGVALPAGHLF